MKRATLAAFALGMIVGSPLYAQGNFADASERTEMCKAGATMNTLSENTSGENCSPAITDASGQRYCPQKKLSPACEELLNNSEEIEEPEAP
ncbi:MAG: hypothetical protein MUF19_02815 [Candidatus Pacebacteria bacterium]|jgi:hypothetical protein|nr:hypothetical protein [Candidatus Paceibacterota bacterium]